MKQITEDISSSEYWAKRAAPYLAKLSGPYHGHRLEVIGRLLEGVPPVESVLDFGCGDGVLLEGFPPSTRRIGIDIDAGMIDAALARLPGEEVELLVGGVDELKEIADGACDLVLSLNVNAYLTNEEDSTFYREVERILAPGGQLVITHSNRLFDLFTLNGFTSRFVVDELCTGEVDPNSVNALLERAGKFKMDEAAGHFQIRENPLSYRHKLASFGLEEQQQEFANLHAKPPVLMDPAGFADIDAREYPSTLDWPVSDRWKLMFICSMFGSRATKP